MLGKTAAFAIAALLLCQTPKPPKQRYDPKTDTTTYTTGDVHTGGYSGCGAQFDFPGKTPSIPKMISMGFGSLRLNSEPDKDQSVLHWNGVKTVSLTFSDKTLDLPAEHAYTVSKNQEVVIFLGRALEESMAIKLTPEQFRSLAASSGVEVHIGKDTLSIKGRSLVPLRKLAACIPTAS